MASSSFYVIFLFGEDWGIYSEQRGRPLADPIPSRLLRAWKMSSHFLSVVLQSGNSFLSCE